MILAVTKWSLEKKVSSKYVFKIYLKIYLFLCKLWRWRPVLLLRMNSFTFTCKGILCRVKTCAWDLKFLGIAILQKSSRCLLQTLVSKQMGGGNIEEYDKNILTHTDPMSGLSFVWNVTLNVYFSISLRNFKRLRHKVPK